MKSAYESLRGKTIRVKRLHRDADEWAVVGFVTQAYLDSQTRLWVAGYVFDPDTITDIEMGRMKGLSMEADVLMGSDGKALNVNVNHIAIVPEPACEEAKIVEVAPVALANKMEVGRMADRPSKTEFFDYIEDKLKDAGIDAAVAKKVIDILKTIIKIPYPYPYPAPVKQMVAVAEDELEELKKYKEQVVKMQEESLKSMLAKLGDRAEKVKPLLEKLPDYESKISFLEDYISLINETEVKLQVAEKKEDDLEEKIRKAVDSLIGGEL